MSHPLHGVNPAASTLQARQSAVPAWAIGHHLEPCPYEHHRPSDWALAAGGPVVCGVCHPPSCPDEVLRRGEAGFDDVEADARARQRAAAIDGAERRAHELALLHEARDRAAEAAALGSAA